jgi:hypothetical protein
MRGAFNRLNVASAGGAIAAAAPAEAQSPPDGVREMNSIECLLRELQSGAADPALLGRCDAALAEGYAHALHIEGRRRRLRERQSELAESLRGTSPEGDELAWLARTEIVLASRERELRDLLGRLRRCAGDLERSERAVREGADRG